MPPSEKRWVVLIDKSPKGPFTHEEISSLLMAGVLTSNTPAFAIEQESHRASSSWKLLGDFSDFGHKAKSLKRRREQERPPDDPSDQDVGNTYIGPLPEILPEDLSLSQPQSSISTELLDAPEPPEEKAPQGPPPSTPHRFLLLGLLGMAAFGFWVVQRVDQKSIEPQTKPALTTPSTAAPGMQKAKSLPPRPVPTARTLPAPQRSPDPATEMERTNDLVERSPATRRTPETGFIEPDDREEEEEEEEIERKPVKKSKKKKAVKLDDDEDLEDEEVDEDPKETTSKESSEADE